MVEVINNSGSPQPPQREVFVERESNAGWIIAVIILVAIILIGGYYFLHHRTYVATPAATPTTNVNVTLPSGSQSNTTSSY